MWIQSRGSFGWLESGQKIDDSKHDVVIMMAKKQNKYYFDQDAVDEVVAFFEQGLRHTKGKWAGQPFLLEPWQLDFITKVFGWKRTADGLRRYRIVYCEIPKKNGKSTFAAGLALYLLTADGEAGAEVYNAAGDRKQAGIVFDISKQMCEHSPLISGRTQRFRDSIFVPETYAKYEVVNAEAGTKHGINPSAVIVDELHVQPSRDLYDTLENGVAAREQPLVISITTAGWDRTSICWELHEHALKVMAGDLEDDEFLGIIYAADLEDDWTDPAVWKKANPGFGVTIPESYFAAKCNRAKQIPSHQNAFRRLHLNQWTEQDSRWIATKDWRNCEVGISMELMAGRNCFAGGDLSSTRDITAFSFVFPPDDDWPKWLVLHRFYMPESNIQKRNDESKGKYLNWKQHGYIIPTPGNVVDYDFIREDLQLVGENIHIEQMALDRWNAVQLMTQFTNDGLDVVPFGQGFTSMAAPTKELEKLIVSGAIGHDGNPAMNWMIGNVSVRQDPAGNMKPDKAKSSEKIDGVVSTIMALGVAIAADPDANSSIYDEQGIEFI